VVAPVSGECLLRHVSIALRMIHVFRAQGSGQADTKHHTILPRGGTRVCLSMGWEGLVNVSHCAVFYFTILEFVLERQNR